ncbi:MAG: proton-conducting transporter membrane subunit [Nocardioidaceae bacterium]
MSELVLWAVVLVPTVVGGCLAVAAFLGGTSRALDRMAAPLAVATATLTLVVSSIAALTRPSVDVPFMAGTSFGLGVDALSALLLPTVAAVILLVLVFAAGDICESRARFHGLMLLFAAAALLTVTATTLPVLLLAWEVMGATSYALVAFWWRDERRVSSGLTAFLTTRAADLGLYAAAGAALGGGAGLALPDLADAAGGWRDAVALGVLVAGLGKAAQLPFSFWLSRAMDGPSPVSALLHSAAMVAMGGYLLLRTAPLLDATGWAGPVTAWVGAVTALLLGAVAVAQSDLKQLLAASTSAQLGFVVLAAGVGAVSGGAAHLVAHAATKSLLFLVAGAWLSALGTKQLSALPGAGRLWPLVGVTGTVGALSLAGVVPLSLWATKDAVLAGALEQSPLLYVVGLAGAALSAAYAGKLLFLIWRPLPGDAEEWYDKEETGTREVGRLQQAPLVVLAVGAAALGVLALPPVADTLRRALGGHTSPVASLTELVTSAVLALAVLAVVARVRLPEPQVLHGWLGLEVAAHAVLVRPTLRLGELLARFDDQVLDRSVTLTSSAVLAGARRVGDLDVHVVDGVVESVAAGARRLGQLARRPQTGQLHQYFIQAVAMLAVAVILLVAVG